MSLGKRLIQTGTADVCNTESVQPFGADSTYSSNIATYKFDGNGNDETGNYNATTQGSPSFVTGKYGQAASLSNSDTDYFTTSISPTILGNSFSLSAWVYVTQNSGSSDYYSIAGAYWNGSSGNQSWIFYINNGTLSFFSNLGATSGAGSINVTAGTVPLNQWNFVAFAVQEKTQIRVYLNGVMTTGAITQEIRPNSINLTLGNLGPYNASRSFFGILDQVRVFNKALIQSDFDTLYAETDSTTSNTNLLGDGAGVALWSLDYDGTETSGYHDMIPQPEPVFGVSGQIKTGVRFRENTNGLRNQTLRLSSTAHSVSLWMKPQDLTASKWQIIFFSAFNGHPTFTLGKRPDRTTSFHYRNETGSELYFTLSNADVWYHIVVTRTNGAVKVYVNGSQVTSNTDAMGAYSSSAYEYNAIGSNPHTSYPNEYFDGDVDQVRVFSKVLSATEVTTLYAETACVHTSTTDNNDFPVTNAAYYKLDNSAEDSKGTADGTETNIEYRFGRYGQAAVFNGSSSKITFNAPYSHTSDTEDLSISLWFKIDTLFTTSFQTILGGNIANSSGNGGVVAILIRYKSAGKYLIDLTRQFNDDARYHTGFSSSDEISLTADTWTHMVITYEGSDSSKTTKLYVNNSLIYSVSPNVYTTSGNATNNSLAFGQYRDGQSTYNFDGTLDQARFFTNVLSAANVTSLYNEKPETDSSNFKAVRYKGTGSTQYISNVGMDLETSGGLIWIKNRDQADSSALVDSVRGISTSGSNYFASDAVTQELSSTNMPSSLEANGFFVQGSGGRTNSSGEKYAAWIWKAGGDAVTNNVGDISSSVSLNSTLGFSIVSYTGDANQSNTIGHGLKVGTTETRPDLIIVKNRTATNSPSTMVWSSVFTSSSQGLLLNSTSDANSITDRFGTITTTTFKGGTNGNNEVNGANTMIAYCFASVSGLSKIGTYSGTGSSGNTAITGLGFTPSFFIAKRIDASGNSWTILDDKRVESNGNLSELFADTNSAESGSGYDVDFVSGGVTINATTTNLNASGTNNYLYMVFK